LKSVAIVIPGGGDGREISLDTRISVSILSFEAPREGTERRVMEASRRNSLQKSNAGAVCWDSLCCMYDEKLEVAVAGLDM
jgi:hypothetical protein